MRRRSAWPDHGDAAPPCSSSRPAPSSSPQDRLPPPGWHLQLPPQRLDRATFRPFSPAQLRHHLHAGDMNGLDLRKVHTRVSSAAGCCPLTGSPPVDSFHSFVHWF
ncbi:hypothetical protein BT93_D1902 [Corymbia citriodora subsp. variegata]|nr:hypothetical protein BT93_D1902 [Corymbia citriodora subsp. variegata]